MDENFNIVGAPGGAVRAFNATYPGRQCLPLVEAILKTWERKHNLLIYVNDWSYAHKPRVRHDIPSGYYWINRIRAASNMRVGEVTVFTGAIAYNPTTQMVLVIYGPRDTVEILVQSIRDDE